MKLAAFVPMLLDRFPDAAFTTSSLEHVARHAVKGFPTYGELAEWLAAWWKEHRAPFPALAPPDIPPPRPDATPEERAYVAARVAEVIAALRGAPPSMPGEGAGSNDLDPGGPPRLEPRPRYLTPEQLDAINPLPNGRKRAAPPEATP